VAKVGTSNPDRTISLNAAVRSCINIAVLLVVVGPVVTVCVASIWLIYWNSNSFYIYESTKNSKSSRPQDFQC
jgi:hypothetical protein